MIFQGKPGLTQNKNKKNRNQVRVNETRSIQSKNSVCSETELHYNTHGNKCMNRPFEIDRGTDDFQTVNSPASNIQMAEVHSFVNHSGLSFVDSDFPASVEEETLGNRSLSVSEHLTHICTKIV